MLLVRSGAPTAALHQDDCLTLSTNWPENQQRMNKQRRDARQSAAVVKLFNATSEGRRQTKAVSQQGARRKTGDFFLHRQFKKK